MSETNNELTRGAKERVFHRTRMMNSGLEVAKEWWNDARLEARVEPGMPFSAALFGDRVLKDYFEGHSTLHRMYIMLAELHRLQWSGNHAQSLAQTTQCLKAVSTCLRQKGQWKGAWEYTYISDIHGSSLAIPMTERAAMSRFLRKSQQVEDIIEKAKAGHKS